ncbi:Phosphoesterase PHP, N-terminal precursor [hydrothermal vent metagenome]|uniref:Phosphoesterase PHP, N-terminal n=1 Tax=hydrothermal vent metagenome TaxID=652676 RepID=A0A3B0TXJ4_9ZZZZ
MPYSFFTAPGKFHRGNLHTHSTRSDGILSAQEVCRRYQAEGYDFIALTDHFVGEFDYPITDTSASRNDRFTTIIGAELHSGSMENGYLWHILGIGLPLDFVAPDAPHFRAVKGSESGASIARRARDAGAFVAIAHPHWSGMSKADALTITAAHAVEIYNHGCSVDNDRGEGFLTLERLLNDGRALNLIATDDAHFSTPDHFGGWVMVKATQSTPEALLAALKAGEFYSSTGPQINDIRISKDSIEVDCSAAVTIIVQGNSTTTITLHGDSMTSKKMARERLDNSPWLRVTIIDRAGKRAWSNPVWLDK